MMMIKKLPIFLLFFLCCGWIKAQTIGNLTYQKCYGGTEEESSPAIAKTNDGGYVIASWSTSSNGDLTSNKGSYDIWVKKISGTGTIQWQHSYGGTNRDQSFKIIALKNGGYIIAGSTLSNDGDITGRHGVQDGILIKLDVLGNLQWIKCYGGTLENGFHSVVEMKNGSLLAAGYSTSNDGQVSGNHGGKDLWLVKTDSSGNFLWQKCYGGTLDEVANSICVNSTLDAFFVAGSAASKNGNLTTNKGGLDAWVIKLDTLGSIVFASNNGGTNDDEWRDVTATKDGGCATVGTTKSSGGDVFLYHGGTDIWCAKYSSTSAFSFSKCVGGSGNETGGSIMQLNTNDYVICGSGNSTDGDFRGVHGFNDVIIALIATNGVVLETSCLGGGFSELNAVLLNDGGAAPGTYTLVCNTASNNLDVSGNHGSDDIWFAKIGFPDGIKNPFQFRDVKVFPTLAHNEVNIVTTFPEFTYSIVDMNGKEVKTEEVNYDKSLALNCSNLVSGMYMIRVRYGKDQAVYRFVKD